MSVYSLLYISWQYLKGHLLKVAESFDCLNSGLATKKKAKVTDFFLIKSLGHKNFQKQRKTK